MDKVLVHLGDRILVTKDVMPEVNEMMDELRKSMFEIDMVLSILQSSTTITKDVYAMVKEDYREQYTIHREAKEKCVRLVLKYYETNDGTLQWNYDQLENAIYVSVNPNSNQAY